MSRLGMMIDLETVGLDTTSAILQIGAIFYNMDTFETISEFCMNVDHQKLLDDGNFTSEKSTMEFWERQDPLIKESVFSDPKPPHFVAQSFIGWVNLNRKGKAFTLMSNHILFDITKIDYFLDVLIDCNLTDETKYNRIEDFATIRNLAKWLDHDLLEDMEAEYPHNNLHNALEDCQWQLYSLKCCMEIIAGSASNVAEKQQQI